MAELLEQLDRDEAARRKHAKVMFEIRRNLASYPPAPDAPGVVEMIHRMLEERETELSIWSKR